MSGIDTPEVAARKMHPRGMAMESDMRASVYAIRGRDAQVSTALSAALESPDPFPALRSLLSALSQGTDGTAEYPAFPVDIRALVRDLRDVGTDANPHEFMGACPNVRGEGPETATDRDSDCKACDVLRRADAYLGHFGGDGSPVPAPTATEPGPTEKVDMDLRYYYRSGVFTIYPNVHETVAPAKFPGVVLGLSVRITYTYAPDDREAAEDVARAWAVRLRERGATRVGMVGEEAGT